MKGWGDKLETTSISNKRVSWKQPKCPQNRIGYTASDNFLKNRCGLIPFKNVLKIIWKAIYQVIKIYRIISIPNNLFVFICFNCNEPKAALFLL